MKAVVFSLSFASNNNYGATLQAWALKEYLSSKGCDVYVSMLDPMDDKKHLFLKMKKESEKKYKNKKGVKFYFKRSYRKIKFIYDFSRRVAFKKLAYGSLRSVPKVRYDKFKDFLSRFCDCQDYKRSNKTRSVANIVSGKCNDDLIVVGSDWVWNLNAAGFVDYDFKDKFINAKEIFQNYAVYFGFFPINQSHQTRVTYAASQGILPSKAYPKFFKSVTDNFEFLSFREKQSIDYLSKKCGIKKELHHTIDPTLLLEPHAYEVMADMFKIPMGGIHKKYILVYILPASNVKLLKSHIDFIEKALDLPVYCANLKTEFFYPGAVNLGENCGPGEFLALIKNCHFVITNSFHGMVFSIMFHKNFVSFRRFDNDFRQGNLIEGLDLGDRLFDAGDIEADKAVFNNIDYDAVDARRREYISTSVDYLDTVLEAAGKKCQSAPNP